MSGAARKTRWGTGSRAGSEELAREQILEAARRCYQGRGIARTTVEDVARAAKVSRTTVYRYFHNRDEVLTGVVMADSLALLEYLRDTLAGVGDFADFLVEGMLLILREVPQAPLYEAFFASEGDSSRLLSRLCLSSEEVLALIWPHVAQRFQAGLASGRLRPGLQLPEIIEWVARLLLSFLMTPGGVAQDETALRAMLGRLLRPALVAASPA